MATIDKRQTSKGIRYRARVRLDGVTHSKTFPRKGDAQDWAANIEAQIRGGNTVRVRATVAQLVDRYLSDVLPFKTRNKDQAHTARHLKYWHRELGSLLLSNITPDLLHHQRTKLLRGRSPATVNRYVAALSAALGEAVRWGWLRTNPARDLTRLQEPRGRDRVLSDDERVRLLTACSGDLYLLVVLALTTAARAGELYGLSWSNVDLDRARITFVDTKNSETRSVPLAGKALELLLARKQTGDKVFPKDLRADWDKALAAARIRDFRFHDLRHTAATYLAKNGCTLLEISQITGHKSMQMVKRYAHLTDDHTRDAITRLSGIIGE